MAILVADPSRQVPAEPSIGSELLPVAHDLLAELAWPVDVHTMGTVDW